MRSVLGKSETATSTIAANGGDLFIALYLLSQAIYEFVKNQDEAIRESYGHFNLSGDDRALCVLVVLGRRSHVVCAKRSPKHKSIT